MPEVDPDDTETQKNPDPTPAPELEPTPTPITPVAGEANDSFPWWILLLALLALLALTRILLLVYIRRRSPIITHIAISDLKEEIQFLERVGMSSLNEYEMNSEIEFLSDTPGITEVKFTIRVDDGNLEHGTSSSSYLEDTDLPSHDLQLGNLPSIVSINGIVSEIIWSIKAKRPLGTSFTIEFEVNGEWIEISELTAEDGSESETQTIYPYCRLVAKAPFGVRRFSPPAPIGLISLEGADEPTA